MKINTGVEVDNGEGDLGREAKCQMAQLGINRAQRMADLRIKIRQIVTDEMERHTAQGHSACRAAEEFQDSLHQIRIKRRRSLSAETERRRVWKRTELYRAAATDMERYAQECAEAERRAIKEADAKFKEGHDEIVRLMAAEMRRRKDRRQAELDWYVAGQMAQYTERYADMERCSAENLDDAFDEIQREMRRRETAETARRMAQESFDMERDATVKIQQRMEELRTEAERSVPEGPFGEDVCIAKRAFLQRLTQNSDDDW